MMDIVAMTPEQAEDYLARHSAGAQLLEPRDVFRPSLIGIAAVEGMTVAVYDADDVIGCLMNLGMDRDDAIEWFDYNISRRCDAAWPIFIRGDVE